MSAHMDNTLNLAAETPVNVLTCTICLESQECPPPCNSVKVRFCIMEYSFPAVGMKCEACCCCRTCTHAYLDKCLDSCTYALMMKMAVYSYTEMPVRVFDFLCSYDLSWLMYVVSPDCKKNRKHSTEIGIFIITIIISVTLRNASD